MSVEKWRCPECETYNTSETCVICGANKPLSVTITHDEVTVTRIRFSEDNKKLPVKTEKKAEITETYDWYCPKCGMGNKNYSRYCKRCGHDHSGMIIRFAVVAVAVVFFIVGIAILCMG